MVTGKTLHQHQRYIVCAQYQGPIRGHGGAAGEGGGTQSATALAVFSGSRGSRGGGAREVFTAQNRQPLRRSGRLRQWDASRSDRFQPTPCCRRSTSPAATNQHGCAAALVPITRNIPVTYCRPTLYESDPRLLACSQLSEPDATVDLSAARAILKCVRACVCACACARVAFSVCRGTKSTEGVEGHLVHVSPMSMMVAVAVWSSPPPQHSPMFGHRASSHTCARAAPARYGAAVGLLPYQCAGRVDRAERLVPTKRSVYDQDVHSRATHQARPCSVLLISDGRGTP